jgi:excisionase family DNA binding protein
MKIQPTTPDAMPPDRRSAASGSKSTERLTLSIDEVAIVLGISRSSAYECARRGEIPTIRFGRRIVVPRAAVLRLMGEADAEDRTES